MKGQVSTIWLVAREYAGIAEAGGVKNVVCSLAEGLARQKKIVSVFIPHYGCVITESNTLFSSKIVIDSHTYFVMFSEMLLHGVHIIFIHADMYAEKQGVYVYTQQENHTKIENIRGSGHADVNIMNILFQKAVIEYAQITSTTPDVLHCQDAHTALLPALIRSSPQLNALFIRTKLIVTIHNAGPGYRQTMQNYSKTALLTGLSESILQKAIFNGKIEPFLLAAEYGNLTTVSPWYAKELSSHLFNGYTEGLSGEFEHRKIHIVGITNGIDYDKYQPTDTSCSLLPYTYNPMQGELRGKYQCRVSFLEQVHNFKDTPTITRFGSLTPDPHAVYFSYHGRIAWQKGLDVLEKSIVQVLKCTSQARFIILGQGDPTLESILADLAITYPGKLVYVRGYERSFARLAVASSDFLVMPSMFEPCGLEDFIAQIFGTIPLAHAVGGLQKIIHGKSGFLYSSNSGTNDANGLAQLMIQVAQPIISSATEGISSISEYLDIIQFAANLVYSTYNWNSIISNQYLPLYENTR